MGESYKSMTEKKFHASWIAIAWSRFFHNVWKAFSYVRYWHYHGLTRFVNRTEMFLLSLPSKLFDRERKRWNYKHFQPTLYHVTRNENVESILKNGLQLRHDGSTSPFISLSENPHSWILSDDPESTILEVNVKDLTTPMTTWLPELDEICVWGDIVPERIKVHAKPIGTVHVPIGIRPLKANQDHTKHVE